MDGDHLQSMITDAYAVVAVAHRRAAAVYTIDKSMQQLGTAAVHLVTMATSYMENQLADDAASGGGDSGQ